MVRQRSSHPSTIAAKVPTPVAPGEMGSHRAAASTSAGAAGDAGATQLPQPQQTQRFESGVKARTQVHPLISRARAVAGVAALVLCSLAAANLNRSLGNVPLGLRSLRRKSPDEYFQSQDGEDKMLMKLFGHLTEGTYLEMGGLDGKLFSNSYVFNKALGWKGVLIELIEDNYKEMVKNRPDEIANIHAGVCASSQTLHSVQPQSGIGVGAVGGIYEFAAPSFREQWWKDIELDGPGVKKIQCDALDRLLLKHAPDTTFFDFFSLDVEGAELTVLESTDFDRVGFGIIFVEADKHNDAKNLAMRRFLEGKGYTYLFGYGRSYWFGNSNFDKIYEHLHLPKLNDIDGEEEDSGDDDDDDNYYY
ncbi:hypothetical protein ACHAWF_017147 [Thalassiosira exigua]